MAVFRRRQRSELCGCRGGGRVKSEGDESVPGVKQQGGSSARAAGMKKRRELSMKMEE